MTSEEKEAVYVRFGGTERTRAIQKVLSIVRSQMAVLSIPSMAEAEELAKTHQITAQNLLDFARVLAENA